jgi:hypothetical protein
LNRTVGHWALGSVDDVARDPRVLGWLRRWARDADSNADELALDPAPLAFGAGQRAFEQMVARDVREGSEADRAMARSIVTSWMEYVRRHCKVSYGEDLYCQPTTIERFYASVRFGPALGLRAEAEALVAHVRALAESIPWRSHDANLALDLRGHAALAASLL